MNFNFCGETSSRYKTALNTHSFIEYNDVPCSYEEKFICNKCGYKIYKSLPDGETYIEDSDDYDYVKVAHLTCNEIILKEIL